MCHIILYFLTKLKFLVQWRRHTRACQRKCPAEIPLPWQSKVLIIKLYVNIFRLPLLMPLMTCLCPAMSSDRGVARGQMGTDVPGARPEGSQNRFRLKFFFTGLNETKWKSVILIKLLIGLPQ